MAELDALQAELDRLKALPAQTAAELEALLPAILDRRSRGYCEDWIDRITRMRDYHRRVP